MGRQINTKRRRKIFFDSGPGSGLVLVRVVRIVEMRHRSLEGRTYHVVTLEMLETRGAYKKGARTETTQRYVVYKTSKSKRYPFHQMVRHLSLEEIRAALPTEQQEQP